MQTPKRPVVKVPSSKRRGLFARFALVAEVTDPRDYPDSTKWFLVSIIGFAAAAAPVGSAIIMPSLNLVTKDFGTSPTITNLSVSLYMLAMAIFPLWWSALSEAGGRRTVYLLSFIMFTAFAVLSATSQNIAMLVTMRMLSGGGAASVQAVGAGTVADLFDSGERGKAMGLFYLGPLCGPLFAPILGGILGERWGWRATQWALVIYGVLACLCLFFALPETLKVPDKVVDSAGLEDSLPSKAQPPLSRISTRQSVQKAGKKYLQAARAVLFDPLEIILYLRYPPVVLSIYYASVTFGALYVLNISISYSFEREPYNYSTLIVGLFYLPNSVGYVITSIFGGPWVDRIMKREARKANRRSPNGKWMYLPEDRMCENAWLGAAIYPTALIWYGWTTEKGVFVICPVSNSSLPCPEMQGTDQKADTYRISFPPHQLIANFFYGLGSMLIFGAVTTMLTEFMPRKASSGVALNNLCRNLLSSTGSLVGAPLINSIGNGWLFTIFQYQKFEGPVGYASDVGKHKDLYVGSPSVNNSYKYNTVNPDPDDDDSEQSGAEADHGGEKEADRQEEEATETPASAETKSDSPGADESTSDDAKESNAETVEDVVKKLQDADAPPDHITKVLVKALSEMDGEDHTHGTAPNPEPDEKATEAAAADDSKEEKDDKHDDKPEGESDDPKPEEKTGHDATEEADAKDESHVPEEQPKPEAAAEDPVASEEPSNGADAPGSPEDPPKGSENDNSVDAAPAEAATSTEAPDEEPLKKAVSIEEPAVKASEEKSPKNRGSKKSKGKAAKKEVAPPSPAEKPAKEKASKKDKKKKGAAKHASKNQPSKAESSSKTPEPAPAEAEPSTEAPAESTPPLEAPQDKTPTKPPSEEAAADETAAEETSKEAEAVSDTMAKDADAAVAVATEDTPSSASADSKSTEDVAGENPVAADTPGDSSSDEPAKEAAAEEAPAKDEAASDEEAKPAEDKASPPAEEVPSTKDAPPTEEKQTEEKHTEEASTDEKHTEEASTDEESESVGESSTSEEASPAKEESAKEPSAAKEESAEETPPAKEESQAQETSSDETESTEDSTDEDVTPLEAATATKEVEDAAAGEEEKSTEETTPSKDAVATEEAKPEEPESAEDSTPSKEATANEDVEDAASGAEEKSTEDATPTEPAEDTAPSKEAEQTEETTPADETTPSKEETATKEAEDAAPSEAPKATEDAAPSEAPKATEDAAPSEAPKATEDATPPAEEKPAEETKSAEETKPTDDTASKDTELTEETKSAEDAMPRLEKHHLLKTPRLLKKHQRQERLLPKPHHRSKRQNLLKEMRRLLKYCRPRRVNPLKEMQHLLKKRHRNAGEDKAAAESTSPTEVTPIAKDIQADEDSAVIDDPNMAAAAPGSAKSTERRRHPLDKAKDERATRHETPEYKEKVKHRRERHDAREAREREERRKAREEEKHREEVKAREEAERQARRKEREAAARRAAEEKERARREEELKHESASRRKVRQLSFGGSSSGHSNGGGPGILQRLTIGESETGSLLRIVRPNKPSAPREAIARTRRNTAPRVEISNIQGWRAEFRLWWAMTKHVDIVFDKSPASLQHLNLPNATPGSISMCRGCCQILSTRTCSGQTTETAYGCAFHRERPDVPIAVRSVILSTRLREMLKPSMIVERYYLQVTPSTGAASVDENHDHDEDAAQTNLMNVGWVKRIRLGNRETRRSKKVYVHDPDGGCIHSRNPDVIVQGLGPKHLYFKRCDAAAPAPPSFSRRSPRPPKTQLPVNLDVPASKLAELAWRQRNVILARTEDNEDAIEREERQRPKERSSSKRPPLPAKYPHRIVQYSHDEHAGCEHSANRQRIVNDKLVQNITHDAHQLAWPARWYKRGLNDESTTLKAPSLGLDNMMMPPFNVLEATYLHKCNGLLLAREQLLYMGIIDDQDFIMTCWAAQQRSTGQSGVRSYSEMDHHLLSMLESKGVRVFRAMPDWSRNHGVSSAMTIWDIKDFTSQGS
ncbi:hypothetical protein DV735_g3559, partial [Chaetothyriales sp. CBS 134920]